MASRGRVQGQIIRTGARRAANIRKNVNVRQLQRSNTLTSYVPLNDMNLNARGPMRGRSRSRSRGGQSRGRGQQQNGRSRSQSRNRNQQAGGSITDRLGVRQPRRRMRGGAANQGNGGQQQQQRSRSRPQSRVRLNRNNFANGNRNNNNNQVSQMRRSNSVNARLGSSGPRNGNVPKNTNGPALNRRRLASKNRGQIQTPQNNRSQFINRPMRGRIVKQTKLNGVGRARKPMRNGNALGVNPRRGLPAKRWILVS